MQYIPNGGCVSSSQPAALCCTSCARYSAGSAPTAKGGSWRSSMLCIRMRYSVDGSNVPSNPLSFARFSSTPAAIERQLLRDGCAEVHIEVPRDADHGVG